MPPEELLAAGSFGESTFSSSFGCHVNRTTHYAGDEHMKVPVELISTSSSGTGHQLARRPVIRGKVMDSVFGGDDPKSPRKGKPRAKLDPPPLTPDLHMDLKNRLNNLNSVCRAAEFQRNPFKLRHFVKDLHEICDLLDMPLAEKSYRKGYGYKMLHAFLRLVPEAIGSEVLSYSGDLPLSGMLTFTILITFCEIQWVFTYNSLTHKICNCSTLFPGTQRCLAPVDGKLSSAMESGLADSLAASLAMNIAGISTGPQSLTDRIEALQQHERHFPAKLMTLSRTVKKRIINFCAQVPSFISDLNNMPMQGPEKQQKWASLCSSWSSEVSALDLYYMHFEQLYLGVIDKMISTAVEPVRGMSGPSSSLVNGWGDPFRPIQTAVLCQRLGLLKQQVSFGGPHKIIHFDSDLLVKAQRVLQMQTYDEVRRMAMEMLNNFDSLCEVLNNLHGDHLHPELCENEELRETVVRLEKTWAECQFVLQQGVLDFMKQLLDYLPTEVSATCRWQLRLAMEDDMPTEDMLDMEMPQTDRHRQTENEKDARDKIKKAHEKKASILEARKMFFETLPILMYLDEMRRDLTGKDAAASSLFRELFCPTNDRHNMLKRDFAKFDEHRFQKFQNFLLGIAEEETEGANLHTTYFQNIYRQLREVAAFPSHESPLQALQAATSLDAAELADAHPSEDRVRQRVAIKMAAEARARWVCVQRVAQTVQPSLFPTSKPETRRASLNIDVASNPGSDDDATHYSSQGRSSSRKMARLGSNGSLASSTGSRRRSARKRFSSNSSPGYSPASKERDKRERASTEPLQSSRTSPEEKRNSSLSEGRGLQKDRQTPREKRTTPRASSKDTARSSLKHSPRSQTGIGNSPEHSRPGSRDKEESRTGRHRAEMRTSKVTIEESQ
jgi:hypothetical protein